MKASSLVRRSLPPALVLPSVLVLCGALGLAACSSGSPEATSTTTRALGDSTTSTTPVSTTSTSAAQSVTTTTGTLAPQTPTQTEFFSPSKNISCEIDNNLGGMTSTFCLTMTPARSVTFKTDSTLTECTGQQCLANAGTGTPTLQYGQSVTLGPFTCSSSTAGITCTLGNGDGFLIASAGVTPLGNAQVVSG